MEWVQFS